MRTKENQRRCRRARSPGYYHVYAEYMHQSERSYPVRPERSRGAAKSKDNLIRHSFRMDTALPRLCPNVSWFDLVGKCSASPLLDGKVCVARIGNAGAIHTAHPNTGLGCGWLCHRPTLCSIIGGPVRKDRPRSTSIPGQLNLNVPAHSAGSPLNLLGATDRPSLATVRRGNGDAAATRAAYCEVRITGIGNAGIVHTDHPNPCFRSCRPTHTPAFRTIVSCIAEEGGPGCSTIAR